MSQKQGVKTVDVPIPMKSLEAKLIGDAESKLIAELNAEGKKIIRIDHIKRAGGFGEWSATHVTISALWEKVTEDRDISKRNEVINTNSININPNNIEPTITRVELFLEDREWDKVTAYCETALDYFPTDYRLYKYLLLSDLKCQTINDLKKTKNSFTSNEYYKKMVRYADDPFKKEMDGILEDIRKEQIYQDSPVPGSCIRHDVRSGLQQLCCDRGRARR